MNNSKQAFWVLFGSLTAFMFSLLSSIILSRYLDKSDYGTYKQILYIYGTFTFVFTLGLPKAYSFFLPRMPENQGKSTTTKIHRILLITALLMTVFLFFSAEVIASSLNNEDLSKPLKYFSLVPFFLIPTIGLEGILSTYKKTYLLAIYNICTKAIMLILVTLPVVFFGGGVESAIIGFVISSLIAFVLAEYLKYYLFKNVTHIVTNLTYKELFNYALPLLFAGFWGIVIRSSDQFFISRYYGSEVFADFANGSLQLPFVTMIIAATSVVLAPIYSKKASEGTQLAKKEIIKIWNSVFSKTIIMTYPLVAFFVFFPDTIMILLYGAEYSDSGRFFQIKLIVNFFTLITYGPLILSVGGHKFYYNVHMYGAIILILLQVGSLYFFKDPFIIVWISVVCEISRIIIMLNYIANYFELKISQIIPWFVILKILPAFLILFLLRIVVFEPLIDYSLSLALGLSGLLYLIIFYVWSLISKLDYLSIIKPLLQKKSKFKR